MRLNNALVICLLAALPVSTAYGASASLYAAIGSIGGTTCTTSDTEAPPQTSASESETNCALSPASGSGIYNGSSTVGYTGLVQSQSLALTGASFTSLQSFSSYARLIDNLDILSGGSSITSLAFGIAINGGWSDSGLGFVKPVVTFGFDYGGGNGTPFTQTSLPASNGGVNGIFWTPSYAIADFNTYDYFISVALQTNAPANTTQTGSASLNFSATVKYAAAFDSSSQLVSGAVISSQGLQNSGQTSTDFIVAAPEPSTFALGFFIPLIIALRKRV